MDNAECNNMFQALSTPLIADACLRLKFPIRFAPVGLTPIFPAKVSGKALPVQHVGSVDVFLEAMLQASPGDIMCIDNGGRVDEACIGDLVALEAQAYGVAALIVWGCHRDTEDLIRIGLPVFSYGRNPAGPQELRTPASTLIGTAKFGSLEITRNDIILIDADGAVFLQQDQMEQVFALAKEIKTSEVSQAQAVRDGNNLHKQFGFEEYLSKRSSDSSYTFRMHLRSLAKAIEE